MLGAEDVRSWVRFLTETFYFRTKKRGPISARAIGPVAGLHIVTMLLLFMVFSAFYSRCDCRRRSCCSSSSCSAASLRIWSCLYRSSSGVVSDLLQSTGAEVQIEGDGSPCERGMGLRSIVDTGDVPSRGIARTLWSACSVTYITFLTVLIHVDVVIIFGGGTHF